MIITEFGDPILRQKAKHIEPQTIKTAEIQNLINRMRLFLDNKKHGVGLAAPQAGKSLDLAVIRIRPSEHRSEVKKFDLVIINPKIDEVFGRKIQQWEGCISGGSLKGGLFAKVPRYKRLRLNYYNEHGKKQTKIFEGLAAHIIQHEVDHLNGVLFVDKVKDRKSFTTYKEYLKIVKSSKK